MLLLPDLSRLPVATAHSGEFVERSDAEVAAMTDEERKAYLEHKAKHDAKAKPPPVQPRRRGG